MCKCCYSSLRGEIHIGKGDLHRFSCFSVPFAPSVAKTLCKEGTLLHPLCEEAVMFPKATFLGCFDNVTLLWLLVSA